MKIAIILQVLNPEPSFLIWLQFHQRLADHIFIFLDRHEEINSPFFPKEPGLHYLPGSQAEPYSPISNIIVRQKENIKKCLELCLEMNVDWLIHIDDDELLYTTRSELEGLFSVPSVGQVTFANHEAVPIWSSDNVFRDCQYFKINGQSRQWNGTYSPWFFLAYDNGKSATRVTPEVTPFGPHQFGNSAGSHILKPPTPFVLHYPNSTYQAWLKKYENLGQFGDNWFDNPATPNLITFYMASRDVYQRCKASGDFTEAAAFFKTLTLNSEILEQMVQAGAVMKLGNA